ncbi:MAG: hypothetical protein R3290_11435 [Acidimicrobiia bacterium]|nr:hypothetical protein [Acidimicrobiia bacterium]
MPVRLLLVIGSLVLASCSQPSADGTPTGTVIDWLDDWRRIP